MSRECCNLGHPDCNEVHLERKGTPLEFEVIDIRIINGGGNLKAFVDVRFNECMTIKGFSVIQGKHDLIVSMPRKVSKDGRWYDLVLINDAEELDKLTKAILQAHNMQELENEEGI